MGANFIASPNEADVENLEEVEGNAMATAETATACAAHWQNDHVQTARGWLEVVRVEDECEEGGFGAEGARIDSDAVDRVEVDRKVDTVEYFGAGMT